jgi:branched-chain amino acid transport system permease protein
MDMRFLLSRPRYFVYFGIFIVLLLLSNFLSPYQIMLLESGITLGIGALGFNLLLRDTGLLSFGHGALFAVGAYTVGMVWEYAPFLYRIELLIPIAIAVSLLIAAIFGYICVRHTFIFFAIITMAFSMVIFTLLLKFYHVTGGSDGIHIALPVMFGKSYAGVKRFEFLCGPYYYFLICMLAVCMIVMRAIVNSPFGKTLHSVRDNEVRAEMIGIRVKRYRWYAFLVSGAFTGLSGALYSFINGHITPELSEWVFSGEIVFMTLLGGFMIFEGPIVGAILFTYLQLYLTSWTEYWQLAMGAILILLVLLLPQGVTGGIAELYGRLKRKKSGEGA